MMDAPKGPGARLGRWQVRRRRSGGSGAEAPPIEFDAPVKRFAQRTILDGLSFSVPVGTVVGLLGPNGAGQSTAMRVLVGLRAARDTRDAAAVKLTARVETRDVPVIAIGHPVIGQLFSPHLGCRVFADSPSRSATATGSPATPRSRQTAATCGRSSSSLACS
jgi:ABC-2 type transport system ATP-binding protein